MKRFTKNTVLFVVDIQNDFCPSGALAVPDGDKIIPAVNTIAGQFENVICSQDWHPKNHFSFASRYPGKKPLETVDAPYGQQILWPDHCVQGTPGAEFHPALNITHNQMVLRKGFNPNIDSYSIFFENDHETPTGLHGYLQVRTIDTLFLVGLATDFCVKYSALDGAKLGYSIYVIEDAVAGIDVDGSLELAWQQMKNAGIQRIRSADLDSL